MSARLSVLGAGSILPRRGYGCAGYALQTEAKGPITMLDCGPGSLRMLGELGLELLAVERVLLSHFHIDHCLDLFALAFARRNPHFEELGRLELIGPSGLRRVVGEAPRALGEWAVDPDATIHEVELDEQGRGRVESGGLELRCVRTGHTPESLAWRIDLPGGGSLAYTGDTPPNPRVAELAREVDLFVVECSLPAEVCEERHLDPTEAGRLAALACARRLLLTHFYPEMDPERAAEGAAREFDGPIETARDGSVHEIG
jgi:ribonuclease BN (tRNA processing enzyme)